VTTPREAPTPWPIHPWAPTGILEEQTAIPAGYGDHGITLMVKDPWGLYAYWELDARRERELRRQLAPDEMAGLQTVLRVYDVTDSPPGREFSAGTPRQWLDIPLSGLARSWYIQVQRPNRAVVAEIGLRTRQGRFLALVRSNRVTTPRFGPAEPSGQAWAESGEAAEKLLAASVGAGPGSSSAEWPSLLARQLASPGLSSPGFFCPERAPASQRFDLAVQTELVLHGSTQPKAAVSIQGEPVRVKPDGTFAVRMSLPEGSQVVPVKATSPSGREVRQVTVSIRRGTSRRAPPVAASPHVPPASRRTQGS